MSLRSFLFDQPHRFGWGGSGRAHPGDASGRVYNDCVTFCSSWVEQLTGVDPASVLRGQYATAVRAQAILDSAGGLVSMFDDHLLPLGFTRVPASQDGDIAVIRAFAGMDGEIREIGAIAFGPLWASIGPAGVGAKKAEPVAIWRFAP